MARLSAKKADEAAGGIYNEHENTMLRSLGSAGSKDTRKAEEQLHWQVKKLGFCLNIRISFVQNVPFLGGEVGPHPILRIQDTAAVVLNGTYAPILLAGYNNMAEARQYLLNFWEK